MHKFFLYALITSYINNRNTRRNIIANSFSKGNAPTLVKDKLDAVYGDFPSSFATMKTWVDEMKGDRISLGDDGHSGRPDADNTV